MNKITIIAISAIAACAGCAVAMGITACRSLMGDVS